MMKFTNAFKRKGCRVTHVLNERTGHNRLIMSRATLEELNRLLHAIWQGGNSGAVFAGFTIKSLSQQQSPTTYARALEIMNLYPEIFVIREEYVRQSKANSNNNQKKKKHNEEQAKSVHEYSRLELAQKLECARNRKTMIEKYGKRRRRHRRRKSSKVISNVVKREEEKIGMYNYARSRKREWHYENDEKRRE